jgi:alpha-L-fucosidase 2
VRKAGKIQITKADSVTLLLAAATDFKQDRTTNWRGPLPHAVVTARLDSAAHKTYESLLEEHVRDYRNLFARVDLSLGSKSDTSLPTDVRLKQYKQQGDLGLEELLFQYRLPQTRRHQHHHPMQGWPDLVHQVDARLPLNDL